MLGTGFPLFFILMQMLIFYCLIVSLIFTLPVGMKINTAMKELKGLEYNISSEAALFSYGAFLVGAEALNNTKDFKGIEEANDFYIKR